MACISVLDFFKLLISDEILSSIADQTNLYADQYICSNTMKPKSRASAWKQVPHDAAEVKKFVATIIVMGLVPYHAIDDYWCTSWPFQTKCVSSIMTRNRFSLLMKFLHLNNNELYIPKGQPGHDPIFELRPFITSLVKNCQDSFQLGKELSIDESMVSFLRVDLFLSSTPLRSRPTKWGMKAFVLADSQTGYVYNWRLYTGKDDALDRDGKGLAHAVVLKLLEGTEGTEHHMYMDNWYNSPTLFEELHRRGYDATGTVRTDNESHYQEERHD
eukprot:Em0002g709a